MKDRPTVTGSRTSDRALCAAILVLMVLVSPRYRAYYRSIPVTVSVVAVAADGTRVPLEPPNPLREGVSSLSIAERQIRTFAQTARSRDMTPPGGTLEWSLTYSISRGRVDRVVVATDVSGETR